jgi:hypothetical protein
MLPVWQEMTLSGSEQARADADLGRLAKNAQRAVQRLRRLLREGWESNPHGREPNAVFETGAGTNRLAFPGRGGTNAESEGIEPPRGRPRRRLSKPQPYLSANLP